MQEILKQTMKCDHEGDALILMKAARSVHANINQSQGFYLNGSFSFNCQQDSLPTTLKPQETMVLKGANVMEHDCAESQACLYVSQTIIFNCKKTKKRHSAAMI